MSQKFVVLNRVDNQIEFLMNSFSINVQGYYLDGSRKNFPSDSGIYFVYRGIHDKEKNRAILNELIYIGETDNLFQRHNEHNRRQDFLNTLEKGEVLFYCYAITNVTEEERKQIESALIYTILPSLNEKSTTEFDYPATEVKVEGDRHAFVPSSIIMKGSDTV